MKVKQLIKKLEEYEDDTDIFISSPVQGDCENVRELAIIDNYGYLTVIESAK